MKRLFIYLLAFALLVTGPPLSRKPRRKAKPLP